MVTPYKGDQLNIMSNLALAVYGSLKRGFWNYERFCRGAVSIEVVSIPGKLYALPSGIPVLQVPEKLILAHGTSDLIADIETQNRFELDTYMCPDDTGDYVHGQLMCFNDPETRLSSIDRLEGFNPEGPSQYQRVLIYVYSGAEAIAAWCYVAGDRMIGGLTPTGKASWP